MGDVLGDGVLAADGARVDTVALSGLAHGIVAAVEILALLEMLRKVVAAAGQLAIQPEEPLLLRGKGLRTRVLAAGRLKAVCKPSHRSAAAASLEVIEGKDATHLDVDLLCLMRVHGCSYPEGLRAMGR
jgi:hypothetical protein